MPKMPLLQPLNQHPNRRFDPDHNIENAFRQTVRDILDLDPFTRDYAIFEELRRLKKMERESNAS